MCWRDDLSHTRHCIMCGEKYFGPLGHLGCPGWREPPPEEKEEEESKAKTKKKKT